MNKNAFIAIKKYSTQFILLVTFGLSALLTINGFMDLGIPPNLPWTLHGGIKAGFCFFSLFFIILSVARWFHLSILNINLILICLVGLITDTIGGFVAYIYFGAASVSLGFLVLKWLNLGTANLRQYFLIGTAIFGSIVSLSSHFPINYPGIYLIVLAVPLYCARDYMYLLCVDIKNRILGNFQEQTVSGSITDSALSALVFIYIISALMPEIGFDALASHLFIPGHMYSNHQWGFNHQIYVWALMPAFGDWIYSILYLLGGEVAVRLGNISFIFVITKIIYDLVLWCKGENFGAKCASLIFLSTPLTFAEGGTLFIESIWTAFLLASIFEILKFTSRSPSNLKNLILAAVFAGVALATKAVTFTTLPILVILFIASIRSWRVRVGFRTIIASIIVFLIFGSIPYLYAAISTGNPIYPFYNKIFQSPFYPFENFVDSRWLKGISWNLVSRITFHSGEYAESGPGLPGFQWVLIFLPTAFYICVTKEYRRALLLLIIGIASVLICFKTTAYLRYVYPAISILIAVIGVGISGIGNYSVTSFRILKGLLILVVGLNFMFLTTGFGIFPDFPVQTIFSEDAKRNYLSQRLPLRNSIDFLNAINVEKAPVAVFSSPQMAGLRSDAIYANWYNDSWGKKVLKISTEKDAIELLKANRIQLVVLDDSPSIFEKSIAIIKTVTEPIAQFNGIEVRRLSHKILFSEELLQNSNFQDISGWKLNGEASIGKNTRFLIVKSGASATQTIKVEEGQQYRNQVIARCLDLECNGRVQVNWLGSNKEIIGSSIKVFNAKNTFETYSLEVAPPLKSVYAEIYATPHGNSGIEFKSVSFSR